MTFTEAARATEWWDRLLRADSPGATLAACLEQLATAAGGDALVALVDDGGIRDEAHTPAMPGAASVDAPRLARELLGLPDAVGEVAPPIGGLAAEVAHGLVAVALVAPWPAPDDPAAIERVTSACRLAVLAAGRLGHEHRDKRRNSELARLQATAKRVAASLDLGEVLSCIVEDAASLFGAGSGEMLMLEPERRMLRVVAVSNLPADLIGFEFAFGEGLSSQAILAQRPVYVPDYQMYEHRIRRIGDQFQFRSILSAPLLFRGTAIGALNVHFTSPDRRFRDGDMDLIASFADHAAIAIDHAARFENEVRLAQELSATNEQLTRSLTVQMRLTEQVVLGRGLGGIASELASLLDGPVVVQDHLWRPVAGASPDGGEGWSSLVVPRPAGRSRAGSPDDEAADSADDDPARHVVPVRLGSETVGHLVLPAREDLAPIDRAVVEIAASGVALEFAKLRAAAEVEQRLQGEAVVDLITGGFTSADAIAARSARLGYDLDEPRDLFLLQVDPPADGDGAAADDADTLRRAATTIRDDLARRHAGSMVVSHGESLVVLATGIGPGAVTPERLAARLQQLAAGRVPWRSISVAIGDRCVRASDYAESFRTAIEVLELMRKLGRRGVVIGNRELGAYRLILKAGSREELEAFARRMLQPIIDHDRRTHGELVPTLRAYLEMGGVQRRAAERLVVHVNTVVYRLRRISELLGVDLADPATTFDLSLAIKVLDVVDRT